MTINTNLVIEFQYHPINYINYRIFNEGINGHIRQCDNCTFNFEIVDELATYHYLVTLIEENTNPIYKRDLIKDRDNMRDDLIKRIINVHAIPLRDIIYKITDVIDHAMECDACVSDEMFNIVSHYYSTGFNNTNEARNILDVLETRKEFYHSYPCETPFHNHKNVA